MNRIPRTCAFVLALLAGTTLVQAAERHEGPSGRRFAGVPSVAAQTYLKEFAEPLRVSGLELLPHLTLPVFDSHTVRFVQTYGGLPVFRSAVAVRLSATGEVRAAVVDVARGLTVSTTPFVEEAAVRVLVGDWLGRTLGEETTTQLGIQDNHRGGLLVWRVEVPTSAGAVRYEVNAHTGKLLQSYSLAKDLNKAKVYEVNNVKTPNLVEKTLENLTPSTPQLLSGKEGTVARYVSGDMEQQPQKLVVDVGAVVPDNNGDFLFDPAPAWAWDDSFSEVNVYYHLDRMNSFFSDKLKVDMSKPKWKLLAVPHYGPNKTPYQNAFFTTLNFKDGTNTYYNGIFIGGVASYNWAYDSDVFLHEYTHYVNHNAIGFSDAVYSFDDYGLVTMPGALDEGTADYFACTLNNDAVEGEVSLGNQARNLDSMPGKCPDSMMGETHMDGELIGTASWAVRKALGAELADPLVWGALSMLTTTCSLGDFALNITTGVEDLKKAGTITEAQVKQISDALKARGLHDCFRLLETDPKTSRTTNMIGLDLLAMYMGMGSCDALRQYGFQLTSLFQFKYTPTAEDKSLKYQVDLTPIMGGGSDWDWDMYVRIDDGVLFQSGGMGMSVEVDAADYKVEHLTTAKGEIVIDGKSSPPLEAGRAYHMVILQRNCPTAKAVVKVVTTTDAPEAGVDAPVEAAPEVQAPEPKAEAGVDAEVEDTGTAAEASPPTADEASAEGGSCGCRSVGGASSGLAFSGLLSLGALAFSRRRRKEEAN